MHKKIIFSMLILLVMISGVFAIATGEFSETVGGEFISLGGGEEIACDLTTNEWMQGTTSLGCYLADYGNCCDRDAGDICNPEGAGCIEYNPVGSAYCGDYETPASCTSGSPDLEFVYETISEGLMENGVDIDAEDLAASEFCGDNDEFFAYESNSQCVVLKGPCECVWKSERNNGNGECVMENPEIPLDQSCSGITDVGDIPPGSDESTCRTTTNPLDNQCESRGVYVLSWDKKLYITPTGNDLADPSTSLSCDVGSKEFPCPENNVAVPFFTMMNFFVSLIFIIGIYLTITIRRK